MQNNFSKLSILLSSLFVILSCFAFFFLYREIQNNEDKSQKSNIEWQIEANKRDKLRSLNDSIKDIDKERGLLETHFAKSSDVTEFFNSIEALAHSTGAIPEVSSADITKDGGLLVGVKATGSFTSLYKFLMLLENFPYQLDFVSVDMLKQDGGDPKKVGKFSPWQITLKMRLLDFIQ